MASIDENRLTDLLLHKRIKNVLVDNGVVTFTLTGGTQVSIETQDSSGEDYCPGGLEFTETPPPPRPIRKGDKLTLLTGTPTGVKPAVFDVVSTEGDGNITVKFIGFAGK